MVVSRHAVLAVVDLPILTHRRSPFGGEQPVIRYPDSDSKLRSEPPARYREGLKPAGEES